jgi:hypothetical protein
VALNQAVWELLRGHDLADLPGRLVGYYWAERGVVVIFTPVLARLARPSWLITDQPGTTSR